MGSLSFRYLFWGRIDLARHGRPFLEIRPSRLSVDLLMFVLPTRFSRDDPPDPVHFFFIAVIVVIDYNNNDSVPE